MKIAVVLLAFVALSAAKPSELQTLLKQLRDVIDAGTGASVEVGVSGSVETTDPGSKPLPPIKDEEDGKRMVVDKILAIFNETLNTQAIAAGEITPDEAKYILEELKEAFEYLQDSHLFALTKPDDLDLNEAHQSVDCFAGSVQFHIERAVKLIQSGIGVDTTALENYERVGYLLGEIERIGYVAEEKQLHLITLVFRTLVYGYGAEPVCEEHLENPECFVNEVGNVLDRLTLLFENTYSAPICQSLVTYLTSGGNISESGIEENLTADLRCIVDILKGLRAEAAKVPDFLPDSQFEDVSAVSVAYLSGLVTVKANAEMALWPMFHVYAALESEVGAGGGTPTIEEKRVKAKLHKGKEIFKKAFTSVKIQRK